MPTREGIYCRNVFSSWKRRNTSRFRTLLFGKEAVKTFFYKYSNSGKMNPLPQPINGNKVVGAVMLLPKFLSEKSLENNRSIFCLKNLSCDRRNCYLRPRFRDCRITVKNSKWHVSFYSMLVSFRFPPIEIPTTILPIRSVPIPSN